MSPVDELRPLVLLVNWRDTTHPEGGGSERYVERLAEGLAPRGYRVLIQCAAHERAPEGEWVSGVRFRRRGNKYTVYLHALWRIARTKADVIVDVQNGMPFFSRLLARCPVIVLVHHLHREQWISAFGRVLGRLGWWIESLLAPRLYRDCRYLTVSEVTRADLAGLGVRPERTSIVYNGLDEVPDVRVERMAQPTLVAVSRLVPHKRLEHAIDVVARLRDRFPETRLEIVGQGPWLDTLRDYAGERGVTDQVILHGWVDEHRKHEILSRSWVHLCPSVREGWGIAIMEAAACGVPTVAYRTAGGVEESVVDGETGLLADDFDEFVGHVERLITRNELRTVMGSAGRSRAGAFSWDSSQAEFEKLIRQTSGLAAPRPRVIESAHEFAE